MGLVIAAAAYYSWWIFWSGDNFQTHSANASNREAIVRLQTRLRIGADHEAVLQEYWSNRTQELRLHADNPEAWLISMPVEFGASDWTLIVEFHGGRVSAVRVRSSDGPRPREAPGDKVGPADIREGTR